MSVLQKQVFHAKKCVCLPGNVSFLKSLFISLCFGFQHLTLRFNTENICFLYFCLIFAFYIEFLK